MIFPSSLCHSFFIVPVFGCSDFMFHFFCTLLNPARYSSPKCHFLLKHLDSQRRFFLPKISIHLQRCTAPRSPSSTYMLVTYDCVNSIFQLGLIACGNVLEQNTEPKTTPSVQVIGLAWQLRYHLCVCVCVCVSVCVCLCDDDEYEPL